MFSSNGCCTVICLHSCYLAMGLHAIMYILRVSETVQFYFILMLSTSLDRNRYLIIEILCLIIQIDVVSEMSGLYSVLCLLEKTVFHLVNMRTCNFVFPVFICFTSMITDRTNYSEILFYILNCKKLKYFLILWSQFSYWWYIVDQFKTPYFCKSIYMYSEMHILHPFELHVKNWSFISEKYRVNWNETHFLGLLFTTLDMDFLWGCSNIFL
jgi:hypothetical protein